MEKEPDSLKRAAGHFIPEGIEEIKINNYLNLKC